MYIKTKFNTPGTRGGSKKLKVSDYNGQYLSPEPKVYFTNRLVDRGKC